MNKHKKRIFPFFLLIILIISACTSKQSVTDPPETEVAATLLPTDTVPPEPETTSIPTESPTETPTIVPTPKYIPYSTPDWFKNGVLYEIYVRSFADSDGDGIGDFNGITQKLDYVASLGTDVIWLMPIHPSPSVHGYDVIDFYAVNPEYGTFEDFQRLVEEAHNRGIRIILDLVASHLSTQNELFQDALGNPDSPFDTWFGFSNEANTEFGSFANLGTMPRFNHRNQEVADYLTDIALFWMDLDGDGDYTDGVDGYRIDNAIFPPKEFFTELRQAMKRANPDSLLLAELWFNQLTEYEGYLGDQFDAIFNFSLHSVMQAGVDSNQDGLLAGQQPAALLSRVLDAQADYPEEFIVVNFLSNHDTNRLNSELGGDIDRQIMAAAFSAFIPGPIAIYYGDEIGMPGVKGGPPYWDSYRREPMDWYAAEEGPGMTTWFRVPDRWNQPDDGFSVEEQEADPASILNAYRYFLDLKKSLPVLVEGDIQTLRVAAVGRKSWVGYRTTEGQSIVGVFNFNTEETEITIQEFPFSSDGLVDFISGDPYPASTEGEEYSITLPGGGYVWFLLDK